jgi:uncharacterized membrane protein (UPF0127 family)
MAPTREHVRVKAISPRLFLVLLLQVLALLCAYACSPVNGSEAQTPAKVAKPDASDKARDEKPQPYVELSPAGREAVRVRVEVVQTPDARQKGLMYRRHLDEDAGMLFIFERPEPLTFWMRNTYIPLDMIFISSDWKVVGIVEKATPQTDTPRSVFGVSQYVLEVNAGFSFRHGLAAGTDVRFLDAEKAVENKAAAKAPTH